jgi:hypothetical protein
MPAECRPERANQNGGPDCWLRSEHGSAFQTSFKLTPMADEKKWRAEMSPDKKELCWDGGGYVYVYDRYDMYAFEPELVERIATLLNLAEGIPTEELGERVRVTKPVDPNSLTPYPIRVQIGAEFNRRTLGGTAWATSADEIEQISLGLRTYKP